MNITRLSIENNRVTLMILAVIILAGLQAFFSLPRAYDPGFTIRAAQITTYFPGASPERVEQLISSKLEDAINEMPELDHVTSESRTGVSIVVVNIKESYTRLRPIWDNLRRKVDDIAGELPAGISGPYVNDEFGDVFGIVLGLTGEGFSYAQMQQAAEQMQDRLRRLPDAAKVEVLGQQDERVFVEYDNARLAELGLSPAQLSQSLAQRNIVAAGGQITLASERIVLEPSGNYESLADIEKTIIQVPGTDRIVYLEDIARIYRDYIDPPGSLVRVGGQPALALSISMREGGNNVELGQQVKALLVESESVYPYGMEFEVVNFSPAEVEAKVKAFSGNLLQAVLVVAGVVLVALGLRTGMVVASLIPTAMLLSMLVMSYLNIGLDQISLAALIIALGMLVDNGIVMSENIMVQMQKGKKPVDAAIDSATELRLPLTTASFTTAAAFLPIFLAESNVGEFTASIFKVVAITLVCSLILSLTVIPLLCVLFLRVKRAENTFDTPFYRGYRHTLQTLIAHKTLVLAVVIAVFAGSVYLTKFLPNIFFPPSDRPYFKVQVELPFGTSIDTTEKVVKDIERYMETELLASGNPTGGVTNWVSYVGNAGPRFILSHNPKPSSDNYALFVINTTSARVIGEMMQKLDNYTYDHFPDLEAKIRRIENGPAVENPVEIRLFGDDTEIVFKHVEELRSKMSSIRGLKNITDDWGQRIKKLVVDIDQQRALRSGLTSEDIAISLQAGLSGIEMTEYREGEDIVPVELRSYAATQRDISKMFSLAVYSQASGQSVPLAQVADIEVAWEPGRIKRRDGVKTVGVGAQLESGYTAAELVAQLLPWLDRQQENWPLGYGYEVGGELESSGKANQSIFDKLPVATFIILLLLVGQFNSIRKSFIVLMTIPLGFIGVILGLLLGDSFFGFMTLLGVISLAGIVINNAIVLLERIDIEQHENGLEPGAAIISAAQQRLRPILVTTVTTVLGMLPLYLGGGELWEPMTIAIMAGLLFSTVLTLGVVPVLYALLFRVK